MPVAAIALAYLMGALPTAYLVGLRLSGIDIRRHGSRNPGALNAYRQFGKVAGLLVLAVDTVKGALAIFIGQRLGAPDYALYLSAVAATLGHNFSPFLHFRGGKGAAVVLGISALMLLEITAISAAFGAVLMAATRHTVWSLTGVFLLLNALTIGTGQPPGQIALCLGLSIIVAGTHVVRRYPELAPAVREGNLRKLMRIE
jgi:acyl-phosphate glycerol 3-phosphate acyltransferase